MVSRDLNKGRLKSTYLTNLLRELPPTLKASGKDSSGEGLLIPRAPLEACILFTQLRTVVTTMGKINALNSVVNQLRRATSRRSFFVNVHVWERNDMAVAESRKDLRIVIHQQCGGQVFVKPL